MSLSDRIRPNSEAAPWVIEEVKLLETKLRIAIEILKTIEVNCSRDDTTAWSLASNGLEEIESIE